MGPPISAVFGSEIMERQHKLIVVLIIYLNAGMGAPVAGLANFKPWLA